MKAKIKWLILLACLAASYAQGAFVPPTRDQLEEAAKHPPKVVVLLHDASVTDAAVVGKDVIIEILQLGLKPKERDARIAMLVTYLFQAMAQDDWTSLAVELAKAVAASPKASMSSAIVSGIQRTIIGVSDVDTGSAFGNAYNMAMQTVAGAPGGGKSVPPQPPPPPVALPYEGQRLR